MNWRWPEGVPNGTSTYEPWFVILWRLVWFIPITLTMTAFLIIAVVGWGPEMTRRILREVW